jgi:Flp pilus assembly pilin Flp
MPRNKHTNGMRPPKFILKKSFDYIYEGIWSTTTLAAVREPVDLVDVKIIRNSKAVPFRMRKNKGQTLVEYALILAFISVVAISVLIKLGSGIKSAFTTISSQLAVAGSSH